MKQNLVILILLLITSSGIIYATPSFEPIEVELVRSHRKEKCLINRRNPQNIKIKDMVRLSMRSETFEVISIPSYRYDEDKIDFTYMICMTESIDFKLQDVQKTKMFTVSFDLIDLIPESK